MNYTLLILIEMVSYEVPSKASHRCDLVGFFMVGVSARRGQEAQAKFVQVCVCVFLKCIACSHEAIEKGLGHLISPGVWISKAVIETCGGSLFAWVPTNFGSFSF